MVATEEQYKARIKELEHDNEFLDSELDRYKNKVIGALISGVFVGAVTIGAMILVWF